MYSPTTGALPATGGAALLGLAVFGSALWYVWVGVTLVCLGALVFGLVRLRLAEMK